MRKPRIEKCSKRNNKKYVLPIAPPLKNREDEDLMLSSSNSIWQQSLSSVSLSPLQSLSEAQQERPPRKAYGCS